MDEGFDVEPPDEDDFPAMLAFLDGRLDRETIAHVLGVKEPELELIAIGHAPKPGAGDRLKMLYALARRTDGDLTDPGALMRAAGLASPEGRLMVPIQLVPRMKTFFIAFLVVDAILFAVFFLVLALRA